MSGLHIHKNGTPEVIESSDGRLTLSVPIQFKRRAGRKLITLPNGESGEPRPWGIAPTALQLALARGHRWLAMLESGKVSSLREIAGQEGVDNSYVSRMMNLTVLAPDSVLVSAIIDGFTNIDANESEEIGGDFDDQEPLTVDDDDKDDEKESSKRLEERKREVLIRFESLRKLFEDTRRVYDKEGYGTSNYIQAQKALSSELITIRFTAKTTEQLCEMVRSQVCEIQENERQLRQLIVDKCGYCYRTVRIPIYPHAKPHKSTHR